MLLTQFLTGLNVWCGVALSVAGSLAAAPKALPELAKMLRLDRLRFVLWLSKWLPFLRKDSAYVSLRAAGTSVGTSWAIGEVRGRAVDTSSVEAQLAQLWKELDQLHEDIVKVRLEYRARAAQIEARINDVEGRLQTALAELTNRFNDAQKEQVELDARALPLIGIGIVLTEASGWLADFGLWINLIALVVVMGFSAQVIRPQARQASAAIVAGTRGWWRRRVTPCAAQFDALPWRMQALMLALVSLR